MHWPGSDLSSSSGRFKIRNWNCQRQSVDAGVPVSGCARLLIPGPATTNGILCSAGAPSIRRYQRSGDDELEGGAGDAADTGTHDQVRCDAGITKKDSDDESCAGSDDHARRRLVAGDGAGNIHAPSLLVEAVSRQCRWS